jgi:hypothetical protein
MLDLFEIVKTLMLRPHLLKPIGLKTTANEATILEMFKKADADNSGYLTKARAIVVVVVRSPKRPTAHAHALASLVAVGVAALVGARSCGHTPPFLPPSASVHHIRGRGTTMQRRAAGDHTLRVRRGGCCGRAPRAMRPHDNDDDALFPPRSSSTTTHARPSFFPLARRRRTS